MKRSCEVVQPSRLKSIPMFAALEKRDLARVADCAEEVEVGAAGEELLREGRYAFEFFAIRSGTAEVVRDGVRVAELGPGDVMGELGALAHGQRNASVLALEPMTVVFIRAQDFRHLADEVPALGREIRRVVEERSVRTA